MEQERKTECLRVEEEYTRCKLKPEVIRMRNCLREHFVAKGHDRCWLGNELLFEEVLHRPRLSVLFSHEEFMRRCRLFRELAHDDVTPPEDQRLPENPDADLDGLGFVGLRSEFAEIVHAVRTLYEKPPEERRAEDYRAMYAAALPECDPNSPNPLVADLRLPENLLDGCKAFYNDRLTTLISPSELQWVSPPWRIDPRELHRWGTPLPQFVGHPRKP